MTNSAERKGLVRSRFRLDLSVLLKKLVMGPVSFSLYPNIKWECVNESLMCQEGNSLNSVIGIGMIQNIKEPVDNKSRNEMKLSSTKSKVLFFVTNKKIFQKLEAHQLKTSGKRAQIH